MSILIGKTSFLWSLVCLGSSLLFIESPKIVLKWFSEKIAHSQYFLRIQRVLSKWWTYWKVPQNSKIIKPPFSKPLRISVPHIRGWTVGCFRREPRINTDRFPKRAPKTQIARWDPGACSPGSTFVPWCLFHGKCDGENFFLFLKSFLFKAIPVCFWFQIWLSSAYLHQSYTRSPRTARFWILLP